MFRFLGVSFGIVGLVMLIQGALVAFAKVNPESSDTLLMGISLMFLAQFFMGISSGKDRSTQSTLPESKL